MKKIINYFVLFITIFTISIFTTGCGTDDMDGIEIGVTNYANEYIIDRLYGKHATITSIYPDGIEPSTYKLSKKQKKEFSEKEIFIYNGLIETERNLAIDLLDINPSLKIIDTAYVLETDYAPEELWLNPSSLLMMSQNVKNGLLEYVSSNYLHKEIDEKYDELKIDLSTLDVEYREAVQNNNNKTIIVDDSTLNYLEKFGFKVYCIDSDATAKTLVEVEDLVKNGNITTIIKFKNNELGNNAKELMDKYSSLKTVELHKLAMLSDKERDEKKDYLTIMQDNLSLLD